MPEPEPPILDTAALDELSTTTGGDRDFVVELVETYLADAQVHLGAIAAAVAAGDAATLVRPAHTLKSSSATVGLRRLAETSRRLELAGRSGSLDDGGARAELEALQHEWQAARAALEEWLGK